MATIIFPTENDVGAVTTNDGRAFTEAKTSAILGASHPSTRVLSGFELSSTSTLDVTITAGVAVINGYRIEVTASTTHTVSASTNSQVLFLKLDDKVDGLIESASFVVGTHNTTLDNAVALIFVDATSSITGTHDVRDLLGGYKVFSGDLSGIQRDNGNHMRLRARCGFRPDRVWYYGINVGKGVMVRDYDERGVIVDSWGPPVGKDSDGTDDGSPVGSTDFNEWDVDMDINLNSDTTITTGIYIRIESAAT